MSRKPEMSRRKRKRVLDLYDRRCGVCGWLDHSITGDYLDYLDIDHRVPWAISRDNTIDNLWPLCRRCHKAKTRADLRAIHQHRTIQSHTALT